MFKAKRRSSTTLYSGIGDGFIPELCDMNCVTKPQPSPAMKPARWRGDSPRVRPAGRISAGANMVAALRAAQKYGKTATVLPDRANAT